MDMKYAIVKFLDCNSSPLSDFLDRYIVHRIASGCVKDTIKNERRAARRFIEFVGKINLTDVTAERADSWRLSLINRYAANYARLNICIIKASFEYAISLGLVSENPFARIHLPKMTFAGRILPEKDLRTFIRALTGEVQRAAKLALYTGMRRIEVVRLEWSEISEDSILIPRHKSKSRRERTIFLSKSAKSCLGHRTTGKVFSLTVNRLNDEITRTWRRLGLGRIRFHDLRHIAATRHYERNHDDPSLMKSFGWSSPSSALPYHHVTSEREREAMSKMTYSL